MNARAKVITSTKGRLRGRGQLGPGWRDAQREQELKARLKRARTPVAKPKGTLPNPTTTGTDYFVSTFAAIRYYREYDYSAQDVKQKIKDGEIHIGKPSIQAGQRLQLIDGGKRYAIVENPTPNEWDDDTLNEAARLGSTQARALGKQERASRAGPRFFNVTWFSSTKQKRVGFIRPIEATSASDAKRQAKAMVTNEKAVNIVAKEARGNPPRNRIGRNYEGALREAKAAGVDFDLDFHQQRVGELLSSLAKRYGYRRPVNASGSTGRYFFALLKRVDSKRNPGIMEIAGGLQALDYLGEKVGVGKRKRNPTVAQITKAYVRERNPSVNEMSERFQGRATGSTEEYYFSDSAPRLDMSRGGKLVFLKLKGTTIRVPASVVAIDAKLEKLWLGCKSLTGMFKRKAKPGEQLDYGDVDAICYLTAKKHIGNGKPYEYVHNFGENGGRKPRLLIDAEGMPILKGGDYRIEDRGIVN